jgi:hypothetical protein
MDNHQNICVTSLEIEQSPSRLDGIDASTENLLRNFGCELIDDAGHLLELPQVAVATAQTLFHRFYCAESFAQHNVEIMAIASIFLAAKLEECMRSMRSTLSVYSCIRYRRLLAESGKTSTEPAPVLDMSTMYFHQLRQAVIRAERLILERLGFNTYVELPHKFLLNYLNVLQLAKNQELAQTAWNYMNDIMRTVACVQFKPEVLATAAIFRAAFSLKISMHEEPTPWWSLFDATLEKIEHICWLITQLYENPTPKLIDVLKKPSFEPSSFEAYLELFKGVDHTAKLSHLPSTSNNGSSNAPYKPFRT